MNPKPLHDNVIIKPKKAEEVTKSGIVLPETMDKGKAEQGEVVAVGPGKLNESGQRLPMSVKAGDKVMFKKYSTDEFMDENKDEFLIISDNDILAAL
ncbi:co-chaperone GroES [Candidatus Falkowbacteria bacterium]|nr:co-chaperone GroES [Candidatus Falkowbacteria bacterium]